MKNKFLLILNFYLLTSLWSCRDSKDQSVVKSILADSSVIEIIGRDDSNSNQYFIGIGSYLHVLKDCESEDQLFSFLDLPRQEIKPAQLTALIENDGYQRRANFSCQSGVVPDVSSVDESLRINVKLFQGEGEVKYFSTGAKNEYYSIETNGEECANKFLYNVVKLPLLILERRKPNDLSSSVVIPLKCQQLIQKKYRLIDQLNTVETIDRQIAAENILYLVYLNQNNKQIFFPIYKINGKFLAKNLGDKEKLKQKIMLNFGIDVVEERSGEEGDLAELYTNKTLFDVCLDCESTHIPEHLNYQPHEIRKSSNNEIQNILWKDGLRYFQIKDQFNRTTYFQGCEAILDQLLNVNTKIDSLNDFTDVSNQIRTNMQIPAANDTFVCEQKLKVSTCEVTLENRSYNNDEFNKLLIEGKNCNENDKQLDLIVPEAKKLKIAVDQGLIFSSRSQFNIVKFKANNEVTLNFEVPTNTTDRLTLLKTTKENSQLIFDHVNLHVKSTANDVDPLGTRTIAILSQAVRADLKLSNSKITFDEKRLFVNYAIESNKGGNIYCFDCQINSSNVAIFGVQTFVFLVGDKKMSTLLNSPLNIILKNNSYFVAKDVVFKVNENVVSMNDSKGFIDGSKIEFVDGNPLDNSFALFDFGRYVGSTLLEELSIIRTKFYGLSTDSNFVNFAQSGIELHLMLEIKFYKEFNNDSIENEIPQSMLMNYLTCQSSGGSKLLLSGENFCTP